MAVAGYQVQAPADLFEELLERRRGPLQQRQPADVHVRGGALLEQEGGVGRREPVEVTLGHGELGYPAESEVQGSVARSR